MDVRRITVPLFSVVISIGHVTRTDGVRTVSFTSHLPSTSSIALQAPTPGAASVAPLTKAVWAADVFTVEELLTAGHDPAALDDRGSVPWMWAITARHPRAVELMLARVDNVRADRGIRRIAVHIAANLDNVALARLLLQKGALVDARGRDGATPLAIAAASGHVATVDFLLHQGSNTDLADDFGGTALMAAARAGSLPSVQSLIRGGANVQARDRLGRTALMWAVRGGQPNILRALLGAGADARAVDASGQTAMSIATRMSQSSTVDRLRRAGVATTASTVPPLPSPRVAIQRSIALIQHGADTWNERQKCSACHHHPMMLRVTALAERLGFEVDTASLDRQVQRLKAEDAQLNAEDGKALQSEDGVLCASLAGDGDTAFAVSWFLASHAESPRTRDAPLDATTRVLAGMQLDDGSWRYGPPRIPIESSDFTTTASVIRVLQTFGPRDSTEFGDRIARAGRWLQMAQPVTTDDKAFRLFGLKWTQADPSVVAAARRLLSSGQNPDGGWGQRRGLASDAYATGLALVALHEAGGLSVGDPIYARGVAYLLRTQEDDGSWLVHKRAVAFNTYFESGFPHGQFQFISYAGTGWAAMALMHSIAPGR